MHVQAAPSPTVCLLSSNPLTIAECQGVLYLANYALRVNRAETRANEELPVADIYAVEVRPSHEATQEMVVRILSREPHARVLMIGDAFDEANAFPLLTMGVKGMVRRTELRADLARALHAVHQSGFWVPRQLLSKFIGSVLSSTRRMLFALGSAELSDTQEELLNALLETESDAEIARKLGMSDEELKAQIALLMKRFNVRRRWDLVLLAHQASAHQSLPRAN
jgi:DNA-binding NarL/FixJ family response regulator